MYVLFARDDEAQSTIVYYYYIEVSYIEVAVERRRREQRDKVVLREAHKHVAV